MIQYIRGELVSIEEDRIIVDVGGVGYGIFMSSYSIGLLPKMGSEVKIHTYLNVKEDLMQLYGFIRRDELRVFKLLIGVNGIGPKGGLAILSVLSPDDLRFAVAANDVKKISSAPGIGKKTAEKLILELKDKLRLEDTLVEEESSSLITRKTEGTDSSLQNEAVLALVALGYGSSDAFKAVQKVEIIDGMQVEEVLKLALKNIAF